MTIQLQDEALATPSERILRVGQKHPGLADACAEAQSALTTYRSVDPHVYASLSAHTLGVVGVGEQPSASTELSTRTTRGT